MFQRLLDYLPQIYKAVSAGVTAMIPAYFAAIQVDGMPWYLALVVAVGAGVGAGFAAWRITNAPAST